MTATDDELSGFLLDWATSCAAACGTWSTLSPQTIQHQQTVLIARINLTSYVGPEC